MYNPVQCSQEQLFPTRYIVYPPARGEMAAHLRKLRKVYDNFHARECKSRMIWVGVYPVRTTQQREMRDGTA